MAESGRGGSWPWARQPVSGRVSPLGRPRWRPSAQSARWARGQRCQKLGHKNLSGSPPWKSSVVLSGFPPCTVSWFPAELFANVEREKIGECCALTPIQNPRSIFRPPPGPSAPAQALPARCSPRIQRGWTRSNNPQEGNFLAVLSVGTA